ncbi:MAG: response regulator transcription factor [Desulfovibrionaceae bacterium]|jgi:two-component system response regulator CpxR|nr:response regulator transcription factor [Desulfovibrionaceae bacterium]
MDSICIIDDDPELCALLEEYLEPEGFSACCRYTGREGLECALTGECDLVILDVSLPDMNGFEVLSRLRAKTQLPVLMLTGRAEDVDRIVGLEMGADDYQPKPFVPRELLARIRTILRRTRQTPPEDDRRRIQCGDLLVDRAARTALLGGESLPLTNAEFTMLMLLVRADGAVVSREDISLAALGRPLSAYDRSIDVHMSNLRRKLGPGTDGSPRIGTVRGAGYYYVASPGSGTEGADDDATGGGAA